MPSEAYYASEERFEEAIQALSKSNKPNVAAVAREKEVNRRVLNNRWNEIAFKITREALNKRLSQAQKTFIVQYITRCDKMSLSMIQKQVEMIVNYLLRESDSQMNFTWTRRFMKRHFKFKQRCQRLIVDARKNVMNVKELKLYFDQLKKVIEEYDVQFENTWNMNETEFRLNCGKSCIIITLNIKKSFKMIDSNNREYIILMKIINVNDEIISSMLIVKENFILYRFVVNDFKKLIILVFNNFNYLNNDLTLNWLHHFINNVVKKCRDKYILLIVNDFDFHLTFKFFELIIDNDIILFKLSIYFTHIIQSLNVEIF